MSKVTFAIVGMGHIGKRHAQMILENPEAELVACIDINSIPSSTFDVPFFTSLKEFQSSDINADVINICSPNYLHCEQALRALDDSHVVIEKPMGLNTGECEQVISKGAYSGKEVFCVMQNRYSPPSQLLKELVDENRLGKIYHVQVNCFWNRDDRYYFPNGEKHEWKGIKEKDGGVLFTQFSHFIDTLHWLFGPLKVKKGHSNTFTHQHLDLEADTGFF